MTTSFETNIETALVEKLLAHRTVAIDDTPCDATEQIARVIAGESSPEEMRAADAHLAACDDCRRAVLSLGRLTATGDAAPLCDPEVYWTTGSRPGHAWSVCAKTRLIASAAAAIALVCGAFFLGWPNDDNVADAPGKLNIKGAEDALSVAVERQGTLHTLRPQGQLEVGDRIGLFYSAKQDGYLSVLALDHKGAVTRIYPSKGSKSAFVSKADRTSLFTGALVQEGKGCEWLVAVFSDKPLELDALERAVRKANHADRSCGLALEVVGARTVFILPYLL